ncbi:Crp/Fnr family transcriptional regulator [Nubsella zeaxanthinifaciens]|uniref:Crp/Fnr family transcriptional regulator n=1 Tax=Nubsella zeaxanthinifaciens TaxID=392412 RepID=UPI003D0660BB
MQKLFLQHIRKFTNLSDSEFEEIIEFFELLQVKKKEILLREGQICRKHFFVLNGCLRLFFVKENGIEQTTQFAIENWWITDNFAFLAQQKSDFAIQAVETSTVLSISFDAQEKLLNRFPQMERYFRNVYEKSFAASQMRIKYINDYSREELYHHFALLQPAFLQRIPQYMLASYLGFTPEYLSEIKKKHLGK